MEQYTVEYLAVVLHSHPQWHNGVDMNIFIILILSFLLNGWFKQRKGNKTYWDKYGRLFLIYSFCVIKHWNTEKKNLIIFHFERERSLGCVHFCCQSPSSVLTTSITLSVCLQCLKKLSALQLETLQVIHNTKLTLMNMLIIRKKANAVCVAKISNIWY